MRERRALRRPPVSLEDFELEKWHQMSLLLEEILTTLEIARAKVVILSERGVVIWVEYDDGECGEWHVQEGELKGGLKEVSWVLEIMFPEVIRKEEMDRFLSCVGPHQVRLPEMILEEGRYRGYVKSQELQVAIVL